MTNFISRTKSSTSKNSDITLKLCNIVNLSSIPSYKTKSRRCFKFDNPARKHRIENKAIAPKHIQKLR